MLRGDCRISGSDENDGAEARVLKLKADGQAGGRVTEAAPPTDETETATPVKEAAVNKKGSLPVPVVDRTSGAGRG